jgi:hypothetical protein
MLLHTVHLCRIRLTWASHYLADVGGCLWRAQVQASRACARAVGDAGSGRYSGTGDRQAGRILLQRWPAREPAQHQLWRPRGQGELPTCMHTSLHILL